MKSLKNGKRASKPEVTNISQHGFWLLLNQKEYFLSFEDYPWFKDASVANITNFKVLHKKHLYWPSLDIDLSISILSNTEKYPLKYK